MTSQCYLKFQSFNVEGLVNKIKDHDFLDSIKQYDVITLVETWVSGKISVDIEGYYCFNKSKKRLKRLNDIQEVLVSWLKSPYEKASNFFPLKVTDLCGGNLTNTFLI